MRSDAPCPLHAMPPAPDAAVWLVVTTVGSRDEAMQLARALVEARLAACAQVSRIDSVYRWQGAVHAEPEHRVLFKIVAARYAEVEAAIRARHPYALPAIHALPTAAAEAAYAAWVRDNASG